MVDAKVKNLIKFLLLRVIVLVAIVWSTVVFIIPDRDPLRILGFFIIGIGIWRLALSVYRKLILPPKDIHAYGKWAIVTGSTSGIGKAFVEYLAAKGMNLLIISRDKVKLSEQMNELMVIGKAFNISVKFLVYDFTNMNQAIRKDFYEKVDKECLEMDKNGGVGLLINNVGMANEIPRKLEELSGQEIDNMIYCNIMSMMDMTRAVLKYMKERKNGAIVSISSGSGNHVGPFLAVYSATKAFITQFSRSMQVESWGSGVDFLVVTPFYVVSNLYKRKSGTIIAPLPIKLVEGTFQQLGKKYIWQTHGYWFHGFLGHFATCYWGAADRYRNMMVNNRERYDEKMSKASKQE